MYLNELLSPSTYKFCSTITNHKTDRGNSMPNVNNI